MQIDIIVVTYNSAKWIENYFKTLKCSTSNLKQIHIIVVDNASIDDTFSTLCSIKEKEYHTFGSFKVIKQEQNMGFGQANNIGFQNTSSDYVLFTNIDTEILPGTFYELENEIKNSSSEVALWELRQLPYEHPKQYDILTQEVSWSSGAAFMIRREVYAQVGGFDPKIFMYGEDVDLSWRIRALGYKLKYCPHIPIIHHAYSETNKPKATQYIYSTTYNSLLRYRYGTIGDIMVGHLYALGNLLRPKPCDYSRKALVKTYIKQMRYIPYFLKGRRHLKRSETFHPLFKKMQYENRRLGAFYHCELPRDNPLVSIIIRTCQRPEILKQAVKSCLNQTYKNIEIIVVEDGFNYSEEILRNTFKDERLQYYATGEKVGRSRVGNIGMSKARGKYIGFLDDDDLYYAEHIEVLVRSLEKSTKKVAYALAQESQVIITSQVPYTYKEVSRSIFYKQKFNRSLLFYHNYIPIQCVLFEKSLFNEYGGLDESLDAMEDWDLWVRYACHTDFEYVEKVTSLYKVPYKAEQSVERQKVLDNAIKKVREKHKDYQVIYNAGNIGQEVEDILTLYKVIKIKEIGKNIKNKYPILFKLLSKIKLH